jgi:adenine-specific DNA-methyltransferase
MVLNYIGSKRSLASRIVAEITKEWSDISSWKFCDAFSGTGALSIHIAPYIDTIIVNDWEVFSNYILEAQFNPPSQILEKINALNLANPVNGAITNTYSDAVGRRFFTTQNAQKIDGIRHMLRNDSYTSQERNYLIGALISSADSIANVASIYGAFLKEFKPTSLNTLRINPIVPSIKQAIVLQMDSQDLCKDTKYISENTLLYLDPPYNQRQYGANYFPLNAIADIYKNELQVTGITGLPAEGYKKSKWSSRKKVVEAITDIVKNTPARRVALSYNDEGILTHEKIIAIFIENGWNIRRVEIPYKRFSSKKDGGANTTEYLFLAQRI